MSDRTSTASPRTCSGDMYAGVYRQQIRMIENARRACLLLESCDALAFGGKRSGKNFDCHFAPDPWIARAVHFAHAAGTEQSDNFVLADSRAGCESQI